jgi:hypothetical protein
MTLPKAKTTVDDGHQRNFFFAEELVLFGEEKEENFFGQQSELRSGRFRHIVLMIRDI